MNMLLTGCFTNKRKVGGMKLWLQIFSGGLPPELEMTAEELAETFHLIDFCREVCEKPHGRLGYTGFFIHEDVPEPVNYITIGQGVVTPTWNGPTFRDTAGVERYLIEVFRRHPEMGPNMDAIVEHAKR